MIQKWDRKIHGTGKYGEWKDLSTEFTFWDRKMAHYMP